MSSFVRVVVPLLPAERDALRELAVTQRRRTEAQAAWLIRRELQELGYLKGAKKDGNTGEAVDAFAT